MCRMVGWVSSTPLTLRDVLGGAAVERLLELSEIHCHGWGIAWRDGERLAVHRATARASDDPEFAAVVDRLATTAAVVHLRLATPGYGRRVADNHPFSADGWALAHNGAIAPTDGVDALLRPGSTRTPRGSTDSERLFLALRDELDAGASLPDAVDSVIGRAARAGLYASSWNGMLLGPHALYVINHHDVSWVPPDIQLWPDALPAELARWPPYFDLRCRRHDGCYVVASSGIDHDTANWTLLPNHSIVEVGLYPADAGPSQARSQTGLIVQTLPHTAELTTRHAMQREPSWRSR